MAEPRQPLEYANAPSVYRRRVRWAVVVAILLLVAGYGWRRWPQFRGWLSLAELRHRVLTSAVAATQPAVAMTPTDSPDSWLNALIAKAPNDAVWRQAQAFLIPPLAREPGPPVLLFLHERDTSAGLQRAVSLHLSPMCGPDLAYLSLYVRLFDPGTLMHPVLREISVGPVRGLKVDGTIPGFPGVRLGLARIPWGHSFDVAPAQPDSADPSQFTVSYTLDGHPAQLVGRLDDDGGLTFRTSDGSALPVAVPSPTTRHSSPGRM